MILLSPNTITPYWVDRGSVSHFIQLRGELTKVIQAKEEIERFVKNEVPEDNQLAAAHKQAGKKAEKLQADLQTTCNALEAMKKMNVLVMNFLVIWWHLNKKPERILMHKIRWIVSRTCYLPEV